MASQRKRLKQRRNITPADAQAERQLAVLTSAVEAGGDIDAVAGNGIEIKEIKDKKRNFELYYTDKSTQEFIRGN